MPGLRRRALPQRHQVRQPLRLASFDDAIPGAVKEIEDRTLGMVRIEIRCARCDSHLGHVFKGEGFTPKDTRHCVNSLSIKLDPQS